MHRKEFLADMSKHKAYYAQFATPQVKAAVKQEFGDELDNHEYPFNDLHLSRWDKLALVVPEGLFRLCGDFPSAAGRVNVLKVAAQLIKDKE